METRAARSSTRWIVSAALAVAVLAVFARVRGFDFVNVDDDRYVYENPHVRRGLGAESISWAFRSTAVQNWHPVTWLSHMADVEAFGLDAGLHHLVSVLLHAANAILLFLVLERMTRSIGRSALVAALFALHPLHVESVAWVSERKDVLSTLFGLLALWAYARYAERPTAIRYAEVVAAFALGLMTKPMLVTLPFVLLLLDWWPLGRFVPGDRAAPWRLVREKLPLLVLAAASSAVTFVAQRSGGAVVPVDLLPLRTRLANAVVSYVRYLGMAVWPADLAVYYPHPGTTLSAWSVAGAALLLAGITALSIGLARSHPYLAVGWLWYLGTLVPVIGIVQVGGQALADRYTYLPLVGIFIALSWGVPGLSPASRRRAALLVSAWAMALAALSLASWRQVAVWRGSQTLFSHALDVTNGNWMAHTNLGKAVFRDGALEAATRHFEAAVALAPDQPIALTNLGTALGRAGKPDDAIELFRRALRIDPEYESAWYNLGVALENLRQWDTASAAFREAVRRDADDLWSWYHLGLAEQERGRLDDAAAALAAALRLAPGEAVVNTAFGIVLARQGRLDEAISRFREALRVVPDDPSARANLEAAMRARGEQPPRSPNR